MTKHQLTDPAQALLFVTAGNAHLTIVNPAKGTRYTFRVRKGTAEGETPTTSTAPWFVSVLTGPDNTSSYSYIGHIFHDRPQEFRYGRKSRIDSTAPSVRAFHFFWHQLALAVAGYEHHLHRIEIWHEGRCGRCGRRLTVPESIETGIGPVCHQLAA